MSISRRGPAHRSRRYRFLSEEPRPAPLSARCIHPTHVRWLIPARCTHLPHLADPGQDSQSKKTRWASLAHEVRHQPTDTGPAPPRSPPLAAAVRRRPAAPGTNSRPPPQWGTRALEPAMRRGRGRTGAVRRACHASGWCGALTTRGISFSSSPCPVHTLLEPPPSAKARFEGAWFSGLGWSELNQRPARQAGSGQGERRADEERDDAAEEHQGRLLCSLAALPCASAVLAQPRPPGT